MTSPPYLLVTNKTLLKAQRPNAIRRGTGKPTLGHLHTRKPTTFHDTASTFGYRSKITLGDRIRVGNIARYKSWSDGKDAR